MEKDADDDFRLKVIRILTPNFKILQEGETRLYGLDADLYDWKNLTKDQIDALAAGKTLR